MIHQPFVHRLNLLSSAVLLAAVALLATPLCAQDAPKKKSMPDRPAAADRGSARSPRSEPRDFTGTEVKFSPPLGVKLLADVPYRKGNPVWRVDLALPDASHGLPRAVIINVHGGGWSAGDKNGGRSSICYWAQRGYVGVSGRYRLLGEAPFGEGLHLVEAVAARPRFSSD